jgi:PD-(D/E)XK endonuclease
MGTYVPVMEARRLTPRAQGDLGEHMALEWFVWNGYGVYLPFGHSPDVDLVVERDGARLGVQVKTSTVFRNQRWEFSVCTRGGNQSWNGLVKRFSSRRCDVLFAVAGDGRRWMIPATAVDGGTHIVLGGPKYEAYEVEPGRPLISPAAA